MAARTALTVQEILHSNGAVLVDATPDAVNGNVFANDGRTVLVITNADAAPHSVTVKSVACSHGRSVDLTVVCTNGKTIVVGPFPADLFNQSDGTVNLDWTASTSVKVTAVRHT